MNGEWLTRNFRREEFLCRHCGKEGVEIELVEALQKLRDQAGVPIVVTSGYRCPKHPIELAKRKPGYHALGLAADVTAPALAVDPVEAVVELYRLASELDLFSGFGIDLQRRFIHLDLRETPRRWAYLFGRPIPWNGDLDQIRKTGGVTAV